MTFDATTTFYCETGEHYITVNDWLELTDFADCPWHPPGPAFNYLRLESRVLMRSTATLATPEAPRG